MPLYSPATHLHGFCGIPNLRGYYTKIILLAKAANQFHNLVGAFRRKADYNYETTDRRKLEKEGYSLRRQEIMKKLNRLKAESDLLRYGKTTWINTDCPDTIIAFKRAYEHDALLLIGNPTDAEITVTLSEAFSGNASFINKVQILSDTQYKLAPKGYTVLFRG